MLKEIERNIEILNKPETIGYYKQFKQGKPEEAIAEMLKYINTLPQSFRNAVLVKPEKPFQYKTKEETTTLKPEPKTIVTSWDELRKTGGFITKEHNIEEMIKRYGDIPLSLKNVNGGYINMMASEFLKVKDDPIFMGHIRSVAIHPTKAEQYREGLINPEEVFDVDDYTTPNLPKLAERIVTHFSHKIDKIPKSVLAVVPGAEKLTSEKSKTTETLPPPTSETTQGQLGAQSYAYTPDGKRIEYQYAVLPADTLITSHDTEGRINPTFPQELQPRQREKKVSQLQIQQIAQNIKPELLEEAKTVTEGAPIVGDDLVVESGNARALGIKMAYEIGTGQYYKNYLIENAQKFGLRPEDVEKIDKPVLVRIRTTPVDRSKFTKVANERTTLSMSPAEIAEVDAQRLPDIAFESLIVTEDGNLLNPSNRGFIQTFLSSLPYTEQAQYVTDTGYTKQLHDRMQSAIFAKAYQDRRLIALQAEEADVDIKNILTGLTYAAPEFAKIRAKYKDLGSLDLDRNIVEAAEIIREIKRRGMSFEMWKAQGGLFGSQYEPASVEIAEYIVNNIRSSKKIALFLEELAKELHRELDFHSQDNLLGIKPRTKEEILYEIRKKETVQQQHKQSTIYQAEHHRESKEESRGEIERGREEEVTAEEEKPVVYGLQDLLNEAIRAHTNISQVPERRGHEFINSHQQTLNRDIELLRSRNLSEEQIENYVNKFKSYLRSYLDALKYVASSMVVGPAKFNVQRNEKANQRAEKIYDEFTSWREKFLRKPSKVEVDELEQTRAELEEARSWQEKMKEANKIIRKGVDVEKKLFDLLQDEKLVEKILKPDFAGRIGFPDYELQNNNARIKRLEEKLKKLEEKQEKKGTTETFEYPDGKVVINYTKDRVQVFFNEKPSQEIIEKLKNKNWHWSPKEKAWQRKITDRAIWEAKELFKEIDKTKVEEITEEGGETYVAEEFPKDRGLMDRESGGIVYRDIEEVYSKQSRRVKVPHRRITTATEAAEVAYSIIGREAQENGLVILTDKDDNIVSIYHHSLGSLTSTYMLPHLIVGKALNTPKAKDVYVIHNHPGNKLEFSDADRFIFKSIQNLIKETGLTLKDFIVITPNRMFTSVYNGDGYIADISPAYQLPIYTRQFGKAIRINLPNVVLNTESRVRETMPSYISKGFILVNSYLSPVGVIEVEDFKKLRGETANKFLKEFERLNAYGFIAVDFNNELTDEELKNIFSFKKATNTDLVTIIDKNRDYTRLSIDEFRRRIGDVGEDFTQISKPSQKAYTVEELEEVIKHIQKIIAPGTEVQVVERIEVPQQSLRVALQRWGLGDMNAEIPIAGLHRVVRLDGNQFKAIIQLSLDYMNKTTPYHEAFHNVQKFLLTDEEIERLERRYPAKDGISSSERQAEAFAKYALGRRNQPVWVRRIFEKIKAFLDSLANFLRGRGWRYEDVSDIFEKAYKGELRQRYEKGEDLGLDIDYEAQTLYHGTPYRFDRFEIQKVGSGEGVQAFGHGLYFTDNIKIAEFYAKNVTLSKQLSALQTLNEQERRELVEKIVDKFYEHIEEMGGIGSYITKSEYDSAVRDLRDFVNYGNTAFVYSLTGQPYNFRGLIDIIRQYFNQNKGYIYKVKIPEKIKFLNWEEKLSKEEVNEIVDKLAAYINKPLKHEILTEQGKKFLKEKFNIDAEKYRGIGKLTWTKEHMLIPFEHYMKEQEWTGQTLYNFIKDEIFDGAREKFSEMAERKYSDAAQKTSEALFSIGYSGIKYPAASEGSYNYVIFNPDIVEIEDIDSIDLSVAEATRKLIKRLGLKGAENVIVAEKKPEIGLLKAFL
ncbi:MAG: JAB domain-containing protein, partial [Candidatus Micrarchaeia archaeon]